MLDNKDSDKKEAVSDPRAPRQALYHILRASPSTAGVYQSQVKSRGTLVLPSRWRFQVSSSSSSIKSKLDINTKTLQFLTDTITPSELTLPTESQLCLLSRSSTAPFFPLSLSNCRQSATMQAFTKQLRSSSASASMLRQVARRSYSAQTGPYTNTIENLRINADTKVIFQGFTGKQGT